MKTAIFFNIFKGNLLLSSASSSAQGGAVAPVPPPLVMCLPVARGMCEGSVGTNSPTIS